MASDLIDKIRKARLSKVSVDGHEYTISRPTEADVIVRMADANDLEFVRRFVVGWDHSALSLGIPGGTEDPMPFDAGLWSDWLDDHSAVWEPLASAILNAYTSHKRAKEDATKN